MKRKHLSGYLKRKFLIIAVIIIALGVITFIGLNRIKNDIQKTLRAGETVQLLREAESEHWEWATDLLFAIANKSTFEGVTDSDSCGLGKTLNDSQKLQENPALENIKKKVDANHDLFHSSGIAVQTELDNGEYGKAVELFLKNTMPNIDNLKDSFDVEIKEALLIQEECKRELRKTMINLIIICAIGIIIILFQLSMIMKFLIKEVIQNIEKISVESVKLSKGDLNLNFDLNPETEEIENLRAALELSVKDLAGYVFAIDNTMQRFADGDFRNVDQIDFLGDFEGIASSIQKFQDKINHSLNEISCSTDQLFAGSEQVSAGAQNLAQGATEQASSVTSLSETIEVLTSHIKEGSENANKVDVLGRETINVIDNGAVEMESMLEAIDNIAVASENINNIIKAIDDIAFQTNILALNAAVEAARAGGAGKGFAVVAEEVGNLAQKSSEAARSTTKLIDSALLAVKDGKSKALSTNEAFKEISEKSNEVLSNVHDINDALQKQLAASEEILEEVNQISSVVQMNSATSEESAAASEELSSQTSILNDLLGDFSTNED